MAVTLKPQSIKNRLLYVSLLAVAAIGMTIGFTSCGNDDPVIGLGGISQDRDPPFATGNKLPELYLEKKKDSFGVLAIGMQKQVEFKVENKGNFPLIVKKYRDSCMCIDIEYVPKEIPPGKTGILRAIYKPTATRQAGVHHLTFRTNDPNNEEFELQIQGAVVAPFEFLPKYRWDFGKIDYRDGSKKKSFRGYIISKYLDTFDVEGMSCSSNKISVRKEPIDEKMKEKLKATSGYAIDVDIEERLPVGVLHEGVTFGLRTGNYSEETLIKIRGSRMGPFAFQPIGDDIDWSPIDNGVDFGTFPARMGKTAKIAIIVKDLKDLDFKLTEILIADPEFLKVKMVKVENFQSKTRQKFELIFEVPPGSPAMTKLGTERGRIEVITNHPFADRIVFLVSFVSTDK